MVVTSRMVKEDGNILPYRMVVVGPHQSLDQATKTLISGNNGRRSLMELALHLGDAPVLLCNNVTACVR